MSFQITAKPSRRAAARFVGTVRRAILKAYAEEQKARGLTQTAIARALGIHRSVINRELRGLKDITLGRVAELAWAMGRVAVFDLPVRRVQAGANISAASTTSNEFDFRKMLSAQPASSAASATIEFTSLEAANSNAPPIPRSVAL